MTKSNDDTRNPKKYLDPATSFAAWLVEMT